MPLRLPAKSPETSSILKTFVVPEYACDVKVARFDGGRVEWWLGPG